MSEARLTRKPYPSDVRDDEWALVAPYLTLVREDAPQRKYELREVFNALRWTVRAGAPWRMLPTNLPSWAVRLPADPALDRGRLLRADGA
jgi:transposase